MLHSKLEERQQRAIDTIFCKLRQRQWPHPDGVSIDNCLQTVARFLVMTSGMPSEDKHRELSSNIMGYAPASTSETECMIAMGICATIKGPPVAYFVSDEDLRGSGRTTRMVLSAQPGAVLVFPTSELAALMRPVIAEMRQEHRLGQVYVRSEQEVSVSMFGLGQQVLFDHSCSGQGYA